MGTRRLEQSRLYLELVHHEDLATGLVGEEPVVDAPGVSRTLGDSLQPFGVAVQCLFNARRIGSVKSAARHEPWPPF